MWYSTTNAAALENEKVVVGLFAPAVSVTKELIRTRIFKKKYEARSSNNIFSIIGQFVEKIRMVPSIEIELQRAFRSLPWFGGLK